MRELGDQVPANEKARAEDLISQVRSLMQEQSTDVARLRQLTSDLQQALHSLNSVNQSQQTGAQENKPETPDDVIDADFKRAG